jgi:HAD superfamily hydrolase (TIGR01549 family)
MIKHVWFDVANTLYPETPEFNLVHDQLRYDTYAALVGQEDANRAKTEYEELYAKHGSNSAVFTSLGKPSDYWQRVYEGMDTSQLIKPDPEVVGTLETIKAIVPISVYTNLRLTKTEEVLAQVGIPLNYFTHVLTGDDIAARKPALDGFHKMVELTNLPAAEIMYIGDRVKVDIEPAKKIGMVTCLLWDQSALADYCATSFAKLTDIVAVAAGRSI